MKKNAHQTASTLIPDLLASDVSEKRKVAPIALIPGVRDNCPRGDWSKMISKSIKHKAKVKCVHAGDGKLTSMFAPSLW